MSSSSVSRPGRYRRTDQCNDLVQRVERALTKPQNVGSLVCLARPVGGAPRDVELVVNVIARISWSSRSVRGAPSTIAGMLAPKLVCSWVCL